MHFIEESAIITGKYWHRVYRSRPNFAQGSCGGLPCFVFDWLRDD
jgi:hypothetical protein